MDKEADRIIVGRFGRVHGIKGFITVHSFTEPRDNILQYAQWYARINQHWQPLNLLRVEVTDKHILARVEGFAEREQVMALTNVEIAVDKKELPDLDTDEYYWHELVGMRVVNEQGEPLGEVVEIMATGSNDVLVVSGDKRQLIPYLPGRSIISIARDERLIVVNWDTDF